MGQSKLFQVCVGKNVKIITKKPTNEIDGFLIDEDETYYYLGSSIDTIRHFVRKSDVRRVEILSEDDVLE